MIIEYHNCRDIGVEAYHDCKTVREFISKEISKMGSKKENFFYVISLKEKYKGNCNILLYCQEGEVKSQHRTSADFPLEPVLDYELYNEYTICDLRVRNILSYDLDSQEELKKSKVRIKYDDDYLAFLREREKTLYIRYRDVYASITDEDDEQIMDDVKRYRYDAEKLSDIEKLLIKKDDEITTLKCIIRELEEKNERKNQQLKWAEKVLGETPDMSDIDRDITQKERKSKLNLIK